MLIIIRGFKIFIHLFHVLNEINNFLCGVMFLKNKHLQLHVTSDFKPIEIEAIKKKSNKHQNRNS